MEQRRAGGAIKWGGVVLLIVILATAGFPFVKVIFLERAVRQSIDRLNRDLAGSGQEIFIRMEPWDKSWRNSTVEWHIESEWIKPLTGKNKITLIDRISHGYTARIISKTSLEKNIWFKSFVDRHLAGINPLMIATTYTLKGDIRSQLRLNAFSATTRSGALSIDSGSAAVEWEQALSRISWQLAWEGMEKKGSLSIAGLRFSGRADRVTDLIWEGITSLSLGSFSMAHDNQFIYLDTLSADYALNYNGDTSSVSIDKTFVLGGLDTDLLTARDMEAAIGISNLDAGGVEELIRLNMSTKSDVATALFRLKSNPGALNTALQSHAVKLGQGLQGIWEQFLRKGVEVKVTGLTATLAEGVLTADVALGLKRSMTLAGFLPMMFNPSMITEVFSLKSDIRIPYALMGYQPWFLSPLHQGMKTGLFIVQDGNLVHQAQIRDGKLFLNKEEVLFE